MRRESLRIVEPCSADWERMDGDGAVRFCRLCKKDVTDVSAMSEDEARAFLSSGDQPCIRYVFDARGEVLFAERASVGLLPRLAAAATLAFGGLVAGGCMGKRAADPCPPDHVPPESPAAAEEPAAEPQPAEETPAAGALVAPEQPAD